MRILLVEDDPFLGEGLFSGLERENYSVDWVKNGEVALTAIESTPYDAVILDIGLPKMSGLDVLKQARNQGRSRGRAEQKINYKNIEIDPAAHTVLYDNEKIEISRREFALLEELLSSAGRVLSRSHLEEKLYSWGDEVDSNAIEVHIHHLRKRFGSDLIKTVRGVGYIVAKE